MTEYNQRMKAARIAGQADLKDIRTAALHADMKFPPAAGASLSYKVDAEFEYTVPEEDGPLVVVSGDYTATLSATRGEGETSEEFAHISFGLVALYDVPAPKRFGDDEWEAFAATSAQFALYPFARETLFMLTGRLGVPPLTLGTLRFELNEAEVSQTKS